MRALSEGANISTTKLSAYESSEKSDQPSAETLKRIADFLGFPIGFFYGDDIDEIRAEAVNFRARTKMTRKQRDCALASGGLALLMSDWIDLYFEVPKVDIPLCEEMSPDVAAQYVRDAWGLGVQPISNMVDLLELHGVRVFSLYEQHVNIDAFSFWNKDRNLPIVLLSTVKSGERGRMDAAHELGHLVMHRNIDVVHFKSVDVEKEANEFASAFLMPEVDVRASVPRSGLLNDYIRAKRRWGVSVSALIYRMSRLGILSDWKYHSLYKQLSQKGMRTREPNGIPREESQILNKIFELAEKSGGMSPMDISSALNIPYEELAMLAFRPPIKAIKKGKSEKPKLSKKSDVEVSVIKSAAR